MKPLEIITKLGSKQAAIIYCQLRTYEKGILNNQIKYWNDIRDYIIKCY
jgi:hypothetical protein